MLIKEIQRSKISLVHQFDKEIEDLLLNAKVIFKKVDRVLNQEADNLAKQGLLRSKILFAWC